MSLSQTHTKISLNHHLPIKIITFKSVNEVVFDVNMGFSIIRYRWSPAF